MSLSKGSRLGSFEILAPLGAGGFGEVYRARDSRLARDVAIKILPPAFADDPERMARFQREAQLLAALNHPNIAVLYGINESGGAAALIMELVEGPTLSVRIAAGPVPLDEAIPIARQIADALECAHERGIIHRDLKPANIKLTRDGQAKVLDFGLAKAVGGSAISGDSVDSHTLTISATQSGVILGTAAYMPPEQAKGKEVDRRADIWSFGVVLYEMLTGTRAYTGETAADTMASVLKEELDWSRLPADTPPHIRRLLKRCLEKDPRRRLRDIGEARIALEYDGTETGTPAILVAPLPSAIKRRLPWAVAAGLLICATGLAWLDFRQSPQPDRVLRYTIEAPEKSSVHSFAVSPDGRLLAIAGALQSGSRLWIRPLDTLLAQALPGTEGAQYPFWSPDGKFVGFFAEGKLKKIAADGGPAQSLCDAPNGRSGSWNRDDVILFAPQPSGGIHRVPARGGTDTPVTHVNGSDRFPVFLPDGRHFLHLVTSAPAAESGVYLTSLDGKETRRVLADASSFSYVPPAAGQNLGHLLFVRDSTLVAQPFDPDRLAAAGDAFPVAEHVGFGANNNFAPVGASANGVLVYQSDRSVLQNDLVWFDRSGKVAGQVAPLGEYWDVALSPDEGTAAYSLLGGGNTGNIWLYEFARQTGQRFTFHPSGNLGAVWSPRGDRIAFSSNRNAAVSNLFVKPANGAAQEEPLLSTGDIKIASSWSPDGRYLVYEEINPKTKADIWVLPMDGPAQSRKPFVFLSTEFDELQGQLSPGGRWMAYTSDSDGRREIYVRPFPAANALWKISTGGGEEPRWRRDEKEIFFVEPDGKLAAAAVTETAGQKPAFAVGGQQTLFDAHIDLRASNERGMQYDVASNGQRFLVLRTAAPASTPLTVIVNWMPKGSR